MNGFSQVEQLAASAGSQPRESDVPQRARRGHGRRQEFLHRAGGGNPLQSEDTELGGRSGEREEDIGSTQSLFMNCAWKKGGFDI